MTYLRDPAVWMEPTSDLEERIVDAIGQETKPRRETHRRRHAVIGVAAAAVVASAVGVTITTNQHGSRPVSFAATLAGTQLARSAHGDVTLAKTASGWRVHLHATGLPRLDNGRYYEAWLKDGAGKLVAIGTFNAPNDVTLWAGVAPTAYPTLSVTRQVAVGGAGSSGEVVLVGITRRS